MSNTKLRSFLRQTMVFLAIFIVISWIINTFIAPKEEIAQKDGSIVFETTKNEYSKIQIVALNIENNTKTDLVIPTQCPNEPFDVFRYEKNEWTKQTSTPILDCKGIKDTIVKPSESTKVLYSNWNHDLFSKLGRFKISFKTSVDGEEKTIESGEFTIVREGIFKQLWIGLFYRPIYNGLIFLTNTLPGHPLGWAIIILTIIIRMILLAPSHKALASQKKMQDIQPKLEKIKQKYKGDQQKIAAETMLIWKESNVSPMGSCLPVLMQFPFLIAIFYVIRNGLNPDNAHLLYVNYQNFTLSDISTAFLGLNLIKPNAYILPLIVGGLQFVQMKLSMTKAVNKKDKEDKSHKKDEMATAQNMMIYLMPVMIAVFTASLPAGVGLYWGTSTLFGIIQQIFVNKGTTKPKTPGATVRVINN